MKKISLLFAMTLFLSASLLKAQSVSELLGQYAIDSQKLTGSLEIKNDYPQGQAPQPYLHFAGHLEVVTANVALANEIVDGKVMQSDGRGGQLDFADMFVSTKLEAGVRWVIITTADGLDYRFRKL